MEKSIFASAERLVAGAEFSFISTVDEDGFPQTRSMLAVRRRNALRDFYFSTNTSSQKVRQAQANNKACVYFYDGRLFTGAMFIGCMAVLHDAGSKKDIWRSGDEQYYPGGVDDPDYCVLRFTAHTLRYYSELQTVALPIR